MRINELTRSQRLWISLAGTLTLAGGVHANPIAFAYTGDLGPGFWGELDVLTEACGADTRQSPIDLRRSKKDKSLEALDLDLHETEIHLVNNGHTLELEYERGSTLILDGARYDLLQYHFHTLSEHTLRGRRFPMEMHAVFADPRDGKLAVIGQFFDIDDDDEENEFLAHIDDHLPTMEGTEYRSLAEVNLAEGLVNTKRYITYDGSLTTPPCSPIVTWIVLKKPAKMSRAQFSTFRDILGNNFRPLQDLNGRELRRR